LRWWRYRSKYLPFIAWLSIVGAPAQELYLPHGPVTRLPSPDGRRILYGVPYRKDVNQGPELWIEDTRTGRRRMLVGVGGTLSAQWSADGSAFFVNDHWASDSARSYIYDANTLERLDVGSTILAADRAAEPFIQGHAYFEIEHWDGPAQAIVRFHGHTDAPPVLCFSLRYRLSRGGTVKKLSQRVAPVDQAVCRDIG
jgi:hypothetical protein